MGFHIQGLMQIVFCLSTEFFSKLTFWYTLRSLLLHLLCRDLDLVTFLFHELQCKHIQYLNHYKKVDFQFSQRLKILKHLNHLISKKIPLFQSNLDTLLTRIWF